VINVQSYSLNFQGYVLGMTNLVLFHEKKLNRLFIEQKKLVELVIDSGSVQ